jgi:hypothetical protein
MMQRFSVATHAAARPTRLSAISDPRSTLGAVVVVVVNEDDGALHIDGYWKVFGFFSESVLLVVREGASVEEVNESRELEVGWRGRYMLTGSSVEVAAGYGS